MNQPAITFQAQIVQSGDPCSPSVINMVYGDATFGGPGAAFDNGASATVGYIGGSAANNVQWSFNTPASIADGLSLTIVKPGALHAEMSSPLGPGSILLTVCQGSPSGSYQLVATTNHGAFPFGWIYGIDISGSDLAAELATFPFQGPLNSNGSASLGPFVGVPPGLTLYWVTFDIAPGGMVPVASTSPMSYTVP